MGRLAQAWRCGVLMVLKDAECVKCGRVHEVFCEGDETVMQAHCECGNGKPRLHRTICNGGVKRRYRFNDWPKDTTGYVQSGGVACGRPEVEAIDTPDESRKGNYTPDQHKDGGLTHERERFSRRVREERRAERRDRQRNAEGRAPLYFNA